ncbi:retrotransposon protein, putative, ty1-copia subclass [Tanacetum coccineum]
MMNLITLSLSFLDYALETATRIFNMVSTKKVDKTPYELWYGKVSNLSYLKVWGCETLVKRDTPDKLQQRSVKYAEFLEKNLLSQTVSGRAEELEEIQDKDTSPSKNTSEIPMEVEGFEPPQEEVVPIRRSTRTHRALDRLCLNVKLEEHSLWDLNEPNNYKAALLDLEYDKWVNAMDATMQSIKDNQVWCLVDLPPNCKTVGSKWIFKKTTDMDGIVHTYKAHLVAKGYTQTYGVNYEETFLPVADTRAIRILIAIAAKVCKLLKSIYGLKQASRSWNKRFDEEIKSPSLQSVKSYLGKCFAMKDLREAAFILGIKIYRDRSKRLIGLSQIAYMDKILKRYRMDNSKRVDCYCDAGFETDRDDIKSQTGYVFILNGGAVDWKSSKQSEINLLKVHTDDNLADHFMKALSKGKVTQHARSM